AGRGAPDAGAPGGLAGHVRARPVGGRSGGRDIVPGEAPGALPGPRERGAAERTRGLDGAEVRIDTRASGARSMIAPRGTAPRATPMPSHRPAQGTYTGRNPRSSGMVTMPKPRRRSAAMMRG